jgi:hypothetical protein
MQTAGAIAYGLVWGWLVVLRCGQPGLKLYSYFLAALVILGNAAGVAIAERSESALWFLGAAGAALLLHGAFRQELFRHARAYLPSTEIRSEP